MPRRLEMQIHLAYVLQSVISTLCSIVHSSILLRSYEQCMLPVLLFCEKLWAIHISYAICISTLHGIYIYIYMMQDDKLATCTNAYMQMIKACSHPNKGSKHIYSIHIYMYARLGLGLYGPYICIYTDIEACAQSRANIYIYIYTCLNLGMQGQIQPGQPNMATGSYVT